MKTLKEMYDATTLRCLHDDLVMISPCPDCIGYVKETGGCSYGHSCKRRYLFDSARELVKNCLDIMEGK